MVPKSQPIPRQTASSKTQAIKSTVPIRIFAPINGSVFRNISFLSTDAYLQFVKILNCKKSGVKSAFGCTFYLSGSLWCPIGAGIAPTFTAYVLPFYLGFLWAIRVYMYRKIPYICCMYAGLIFFHKEYLSIFLLVDNSQGPLISSHYIFVKSNRWPVALKLE